jgi:hypothetical protein
MARAESFREYCTWTKFHQERNVRLDRCKWAGIEQARPEASRGLAPWADRAGDQQREEYEKAREKNIKSPELDPRIKLLLTTTNPRKKTLFAHTEYDPDLAFHPSGLRKHSLVR